MTKPEQSQTEGSNTTRQRLAVSANLLRANKYLQARSILLFQHTSPCQHISQEISPLRHAQRSAFTMRTSHGSYLPLFFALVQKEKETHLHRIHFLNFLCPRLRWGVGIHVDRTSYVPPMSAGLIGPTSHGRSPPHPLTDLFQLGSSWSSSYNSFKDPFMSGR